MHELVGFHFAGVGQGAFHGFLAHFSFGQGGRGAGSEERLVGLGDVQGFFQIAFFDELQQFGHGNSHHRLSAIGNLARQFLGWKKEDLQGSVEKFVRDGGVPNWGTVDLYYWYYGTLCVFQQGGDLWKNWNDSMKKALVENQRKGGDEDGSWDPTGVFKDEWGRVGQTALSCLCLEVYYRYLPMFKNAQK